MPDTSFYEIARSATSLGNVGILVMAVGAHRAYFATKTDECLTQWLAKRNSEIDNPSGLHVLPYAIVNLVIFSVIFIQSGFHFVYGSKLMSHSPITASIVIFISLMEVVLDFVYIWFAFTPIGLLSRFQKWIERNSYRSKNVYDYRSYLYKTSFVLAMVGSLFQAVHNTLGSKVISVIDFVV